VLDCFKRVYTLRIWYSTYSTLVFYGKNGVTILDKGDNVVTDILREKLGMVL
jgi:hypothetical protein